MDGALRGDLHQFGVLLRTQRTRQADFNLNPVQHALLRFAFLAVRCINPRVPERNRNILERHLFPARVQADCHGSADPERC